MKYLRLFIIILCFTSASIQAQKLKTFEDLPEYLAYAEETGIKKEKLIILNKEDYNAIGEDIGNAGLYTFYGIVYNSQLISAKQLEIKSCWGQFRDLCKSVDSTSTGTNVADISYLSNVNFNKEKKTIIFLYSHQMKKRGVRNFIHPIIDEFKDDPNFDYVVLSLDIWRIKSLN